MFAAHSAMTGYNDDLATGVYSRVRATGASRALYLFAGFANAAVRCVVYMALIAVLTRLLFGVSWEHVATWGLLTVASAAAMAGLSLVAMAIAPSRESVEPIGNLIFQVAGFLGGSMLPLHLFPPWMLSAFRWLPNRVMIEGYFKVASGAAVAGIGHEIRALGLAALVLAGAGWAVATVQKRGDERR
jgi:ABC-type multidrug transport system, permease component